MLIEVILLALAVLLTYVYLHGLYNEKYWKKRGVKFHPKNKFLGPFWDYIVGRRAFFENLEEFYQTYKNEPVVGIGAMFFPGVFVPNAQNVNHILQNDFNSFNHRGIDNFEGDILSENVLFLNGPKWKLMRQNMTPLFTSTKLKQMYYIMDKSAQDFVTYMKQDPKRLNGNAYDTLTNFCSAAVTASVFGIGTESVFDSPFVKVARAAIKPTLSLNIKFSIASLSPGLTKFFRLKLFSEFEDFFIGAIKQVIEQREKENVKKHDFADLAVSIQKNGLLKDLSTGCQMEPTVELLSAQAFFFFIAGVEPSASSMYAVLVELGANPDILKKVQEEIDKAFENNNNNINYDVISEMIYLEKVLSEALRKYPPISVLTRQCTQDTVLPVGNIKISKGTKVITPIFHIHHDPRYYPEPEKFDPERFGRDGQQPLSDVFYMPFGRGGRICIGARFARIQVKAGLVHFLRHFSVRTINYDKLQYKKDLFALRITGIDVLFTPRNIIT